MLLLVKSIGTEAKDRVVQAEEKKPNRKGRAWDPLWSSALWLPNSKMRSAKLPVSGKTMMLLCIASFLAGSIFASRIWTQANSELNTDLIIPSISNHEKLRTILRECDHNRKLEESNSGYIMGEVRKTHQAIQSLDKSISTLEMELAIARTRNKVSENAKENRASNRSIPNKAFMVIGINTAFSSRRRRDSLRETWMPKGDKLWRLEREKGIVVRFVIGHSATPGGVLDRAIDSEDAQYKDFLRLDHIEGYHELSSKTRLYFTKIVSIWDADFYIKADDDVHLNLGMLAGTLAKYKSKPRVYIGCMKSGPVLSQKGLKYHEPEYWKFGEEGNKYFRHATGQIYAISRDLAAYISMNSGILHRYANEDVSLGSWLIGLEVEHVDERSMCCGTPPDCEWKANGGNMCVASFDWSCSGVCKSVERMKDVHQSCREPDEALWTLANAL